MVRIRRPNTTLAARIERAAHLVYTEGATEAEIADAVGIKPVTVRDWKKRPEWEAAIADLRAIQFEHASQRLASLTEKAVSAIDETLACDNLPLRFKAATWLLERADHLIARRPAAPSIDRPGMIESFISAVVEPAETNDGD